MRMANQLGKNLDQIMITMTQILTKKLNWFGQKNLMKIHNYIITSAVEQVSLNGLYQMMV